MKILKTTVIFFMLFGIFYLYIIHGSSSIIVYIQNTLNLYDKEEMNGLEIIRPTNWYVKFYTAQGSSLILVNGLAYYPFLDVKVFRGSSYGLIQNKSILFMKNDDTANLNFSVPSEEVIFSLNELLAEGKEMHPELIQQDNQLPDCIADYTGFSYTRSTGDTNLIFLKKYSILISSTNKEDICNFI